MRITSRLMALCAVSLLVHQTAWSQQPVQTRVVTNSELAAIVQRQPADRNVGGQTFLGLAPYRVNMEHRVTGQGGAVHEHDAELFYVVDGAGTLVTGGRLVGEKRANASNLSGTSIDGGVTTRVSKGDWVLVPEGVPHQFSSVEGALTLMSLHLPRPPQ